MANRNCDILFEYLRSILYDSHVKKLDLDELEEDYKKLGMGLQYLAKAVREMKEYSESLSKGNLSVQAPGRENFLCENLKNIHANLNHLTWQAKQVAKGDYSQSVSYLGEFSEAFNTMTRQLKDREQALLDQAEREKEELVEEAHSDMLTGVGNRYFFKDKIDRLLESGERLVFCYCDLDHLKYINDSYGHQEGDWYIKRFVDIVKSVIREEDVFARLGGDEFCVVMAGCTKAVAQKKFENILNEFEKYQGKEYPKSFSFGIVELLPGDRFESVDDIMKEADKLMYKHKSRNKTD